MTHMFERKWNEEKNRYEATLLNPDEWRQAGIAGSSPATGNDLDDITGYVKIHDDQILAYVDMGDIIFFTVEEEINERRT